MSLIDVDLGVECFNLGAVFAFAELAGLFGLRMLRGKGAAVPPE